MAEEGDFHPLARGCQRGLKEAVHLSEVRKEKPLSAKEQLGQRHGGQW